MALWTDEHKPYNHLGFVDAYRMQAGLEPSVKRKTPKRATWRQKFARWFEDNVSWRFGRYKPEDTDY